MSNKTAIVIGAGIVGLAVARAMANKKYDVTVFERNPKAMGASVRNFGMVWPIGQPSGALYDRAMYSRNVWKTICKEAGIWHTETGSLQLANNREELDVVEEFYNSNFYERDIELLSKKEILSRFNGITIKNLKGGFYSSSELIVDPREAIEKIPIYLSEKLNIKFIYNTCITRIEGNTVYSGLKSWNADKIFICSGQDFETLFPNVYAKSGITKCKLQMMRTTPQKDNWQIGTSVSGGLTLTHYGAYANCSSLKALKKKIESEMPEFVKYGIHVMISQNEFFEFTIGDTHEYGLSPDPFDRKYLNDLVLGYLKTFVNIKSLKIAQTWNGVYAKLPGKTELVVSPTPHTTIVNALSGAGMTLSFGLADKIIVKL
jgi:FAD dependent oxidoreductase TIGR03364